MNGMPPPPPPQVPPPQPQSPEPPPPAQPRPPTHVTEIALVSLAFIAGVVLSISGVATTPPPAGARQMAASQGVVTPPVPADEGASVDESDGGQTDPIRLVNGRAEANPVDFDCHQIDLIFSWELGPDEEFVEVQEAILKVTGPVVGGKQEALLGPSGITDQHATIVPDGSHRWTADVVKIGGRPVIAPKVSARFRTSC